MSKLIVTANSKEHLISLLAKKIDGVILAIDKLAVNASFYVDVNIIDEIDFKGKEIFISLNKLMHNSDIAYLKIVMNKLKEKEVKILFYDMAVYNIAKENKMIDKLIISQDHLNASIQSNNFYYNIGIKGSYITSDITKEELLAIKKDSKMYIMFMVYGYSPIFYSRRYLITNYLKYLDKKKKNNNYELLSDNGTIYPIEEEAYGTTIYTSKVINLINFLKDINLIDYIVMNSNKIEDLEFNKMVDKFINHGSVSNPYIGFFETKTIYKVK